jgi:hypothetical protein
VKLSAFPKNIFIKTLISEGFIFNSICSGGRKQKAGVIRKGFEAKVLLSEPAYGHK